MQPEWLRLWEIGREVHNRNLWDRAVLPHWNGDRLYELFFKVAAATATIQEDNEYCQQLMVLITAHMGRRKWIVSLRRRHLDPEECAADVLWHLRARTSQFNLQNMCRPVLLTALHAAIRNRLLSIIRNQSDNYPEIPFSQLCSTKDTEVGWDIVDNVGADETPYLDGLIRHLDEKKARICNQIPGEIGALEAVYEHLVGQLISANTIITYNELPRGLRRRISIEQHASLCFRIQQAIQDYTS